MPGLAAEDVLALLQSRKKLDSVVPLEEDDTRAGSSTSGDTDAEGKPVAGEESGGIINRSKRWAKGPNPNANAAIQQDAYGASWQLQYTTLLRRALKVRRFEALSIQDLAQFVCIAVLGGMAYSLSASSC